MLIPHRAKDGFQLLVDSNQIDTTGDTSTVIVRFNEHEAAGLFAWLDSQLNSLCDDETVREGN